MTEEDKVLTESVPLDEFEEIEPKREIPNVIFNSKLEFINQKFYFHELIKSSDKINHFIVEDIEVDPSMVLNPEDHIFYLKQMIFTDLKEFKNAKNFYQKLLNYCKTPFAKSDIVRLRYMFDLELEMIDYFELVIVADYGEADRIDVERIEKVHINNFLKNVCILLQDLKKL